MHSSAYPRQTTSTEIENVLDTSIEALTSMDVEGLLPLATLCHEFETKQLCASIPDVTHARITWKLLVFDRLLRQTRINLNVFGLDQERETTAATYSLSGRH